MPFWVFHCRLPPHASCNKVTSQTRMNDLLYFSSCHKAEWPFVPTTEWQTEDQLCRSQLCPQIFFLYLVLQVFSGLKLNLKLSKTLKKKKENQQWECSAQKRSGHQHNLSVSTIKKGIGNWKANKAKLMIYEARSKFRFLPVWFRKSFLSIQCNFLI